MPDRRLLDPHIRAILDAFAAVDAPPISEQTPEQARAAYGLIAESSRPGYAPIPMKDVVDDTVAGVPVRRYTPEVDGDLATTVFFHGGGWVIGDLDVYDAQCRRLARDARTRVVSVHYRLAPEHPFPAAHEDCWAVTQAVAAELGPVGVAGDSAGGNLAAAVALQARDADVPVRAQLLLYPSTDPTMSAASIEENAEGYILTREHMHWFLGHFSPRAEDRTDPRLAVLHTDDVSGVASAVVVTAGFDPLRDEGDAYAARLRDAGVDVEHLRYPALIHMFMWFGAVSPGAAQARDESHAAYARLLHR